MSGDGKRGAGQWPQATAPILDSTTFTVDGSAASRPFLEGKAEVQDKRSPLLSKSVGPQSSSSAPAAYHATLPGARQRPHELLTRLNTDMQNLLDSTQIATVFLDEQLRIRHFTPA